jgi:ComEC/Rec2-related protein
MNIEYRTRSDFGSTYATRNCHGVVRAKAEKLAIDHFGSWWHPAAMASRLRTKLRIALYRQMPKSFAVIGSGVGLGDSAGLRNQKLWGEEIKETFRRSGISHLLAVSGLHVGIFAITCVQIGRLLKLRLQFTCPILILLIVGFVLLVGAKPPTVRAGIMAGTILLINAYIESRPPHAVGIGLGLSAIWLLGINPVLLFHPSFQLSFGAVGSLLLITPQVDRMLQAGGMKMLLKIVLFWGTYCVLGSRWPLLLDLRLILFASVLFGLFGFIPSEHVADDSRTGSIPRPLRLLLAAQFAIQIGIIVPLSAHYFGYYSVAGNLVNLLVIPLSAILVPAILLSAIVGAVLGGPLSVLAVPIAWFAVAITAVCYAPAYLGAQFLPYPMMPCPNMATLWTYYAAVGTWVLGPYAHRVVRTAFPAARLPRLSPSLAGLFALAMLTWALGGRVQSSLNSPRLLIPDAVARSRVAACPMPILVSEGETALFNPGSASAAKFTVVPILRSVAREPVTQIVCTTERVRSGLGGTRYLASQFADATAYVPRPLLDALSDKLACEPVTGNETGSWKLMRVLPGHVLLQYQIGDRVVWTVPDVATLLAVAREIPVEASCDVLVLPWRVSDRADSPSQTKFMAALATIIGRLQPDCAIVIGGAHPVYWGMLVRELEEKSSPTHLIRTSGAGMVIIGTAGGVSGMTSYLGGPTLDRWSLNRETGPGKAHGSPEGRLK